MKTYIGVDLGGTNVRVAKVNEEGLILYQQKSESYAQEGPKKVMANLIEMIANVPEINDVSGIGLGVPGPVDATEGKMLISSNLPGFAGYPIASEISAIFNKPTYVDNDANVAALAEARVGAGKGLPIVYYTTLSTGIGGGFVVNGSVISGKHGYAGEIGNIIIDPTREKITYLNIGAVENEASGTAIVRKAKEAMPNEDIPHAGVVFEMAKNGNEVAKKIVDQAIIDLATMYSVIAHVCDPYAFVLGGGMMKSKDLFLPQLQEAFKERVHEKMRDIQFLPAQLEEPGIIGAAMLPISRGK